MPALQPNQFIFFAIDKDGKELTKPFLQESILSYTVISPNGSEVMADAVLVDIYSFAVQSAEGLYEILIEGEDNFRDLVKRFSKFREAGNADCFRVSAELNPKF